MALPNKRGFTLIELLVVISIIALLASLLYPMVGRALERGRRAKCAGNLQQLGLIFLNFAQDHDGYLPWGDKKVSESMREDGSLAVGYKMTHVMMNLYTNRYITSYAVFICPSDKIDGTGEDAKEVKVAIPGQRFGSLGNCSYMYIVGYNVLSSQERHSLAPVLTDESNEEEIGRLQAGNMPAIGPGDNHGADYRNVLFLDGHMQRIENADAANAIFTNLVNTRILESID